MRHLLFFILLLGQQMAFAQYFSGAKVVDSLEDNKFYFVGQLHCNQANTVIEKELLSALNRKYGVRYYILEYGQSVALLFNEYLKTGQDSFLTCINSIATFSLIKAVEAYNDSLKEDKKIKFYGLDFEDRYDGRFTRNAIQLIVERSKLSSVSPLLRLLQSIVQAQPREMQTKLEKLRFFMVDNQKESRMLLKEYYTDLVLIANAQYEFSPKRDDAMIDNFDRLYSELLLTNNDPRFFASFGTGHINPPNRKGIAMRLLKDDSSPVREKVSVIGVQYINSSFFKESVSKSSDGNLSFLCKDAVSVLQSFVDFQKSPAISFISKESLASLNCNKAVTTFSGLLIIQNFDKAALCDWQ